MNVTMKIVQLAVNTAVTVPLRICKKGVVKAANIVLESRSSRLKIVAMASVPIGASMKVRLLLNILEKSLQRWNATDE